MEQMRNSYEILVGKPEGKTPLGRPKRRWKDNIKMDLRCGRIHLSLNKKDLRQAPGNATMKLRVP